MGPESQTRNPRKPAPGPVGASPLFGPAMSPGMSAGTSANPTEGNGTLPSLEGLIPVVTAAQMLAGVSVQAFTTAVQKQVRHHQTPITSLGNLAD